MVEIEQNETPNEKPITSTPPLIQNKRFLNRKMFLIFVLILILIPTIFFIILNTGKVSLGRKMVPSVSSTPYPTPFPDQIFMDKGMGIEVTWSGGTINPKFLKVRTTASNIVRFVAQMPNYNYNCPPTATICKGTKAAGINNETELAVLTLGKHIDLSNYVTCDPQNMYNCISQNGDGSTGTITKFKLGEVDVEAANINEMDGQHYIVQTINPPYLEFDSGIDTVKSLKFLNITTCPTDTIACPDGSSMSRVGPRCSTPSCPDYEIGKFCGGGEFGGSCPTNYGCKFQGPYPTNWGYCVVDLKSSTTQFSP